MFNKAQTVSKTGDFMPSPMPVDRPLWAKQLNMCNFINSYYQYRDVKSLPSCEKVLIVGPGQGLDAEILKWRGYNVKTFDIDETFSPDFIGSVHDLSRFQNLEFDAIIASHVLEHLPVNFLDSALKEMARVAKYSIIYLPVHGMHLHLSFLTNYKNLKFSLIIDIFNYFKKTNGMTPRFMNGMHYWEIGLRGWRINEFKKRLRKYFIIENNYRNKDWLNSYNFVLRSSLTF
jgi:hypothetical protein